MNILKHYEYLLFKYFQYDVKLIELIQLLGSQAEYSKEEISYLEIIESAFEEISQNRQIYENQSLKISWWEYPYLDIEDRILNKHQYGVLHEDIRILLSNYSTEKNMDYFYLIIGDGDVGIDFVGKMLIFLLNLDERYKYLMEDPYFKKKILDSLSDEISYEKTEQFLTVAKRIRGNECRYIPLIKKLYKKMLLLEVSEEFYQEYIAENPKDLIKPPLDIVEEFIIRDFEQHVRYIDNKSTYFWCPFYLLGTKFIKVSKKMVNEIEAWTEEYIYLTTTS
ncbi:MAG: hypothetical protein GX306_09490 [Clostridiales bacterium]|nr:hypothetical protein [Clostridiales bacterium]